MTELLFTRRMNTPNARRHSDGRAGNECRISIVRLYLVWVAGTGLDLVSNDFQPQLKNSPSQI
jgi:hypothetical protein